MHQGIYRAVLVLWFGLSSLTASASTILTGDVWDVTGDDGFYTWTGSTLVFTSQTPAPSGSDFAIEGYFDWMSSGGHSGRELFRGTFFADHTLRFDGYQLIDPVGIVLANYTGRLSADGNTIIGAWGTGVVPGSGIPGDFQAVRRAAVVAVPEPVSAWLFVSGLLGLIGLAKGCRAG